MTGEILSNRWVLVSLIVGAALFLAYSVLLLLSRRFLSSIGAQDLAAAGADSGIRPILARLARRAGWEEPRLYFLEETSPNALCFRGGRGAIVLTRGLLEALTHEELEAVLAHCLAQIYLPRYRFSRGAALLALPLTRIGKNLPLGLGVLFQGFASLLVRCLVAPDRVFEADETAARMIENPDLVAISLRKLTSLTQKIPMGSSDVALDHLFIVPALRSDSLAPTLTTYPPAEERIRRLLAIPLSC